MSRLDRCLPRLGLLLVLGLAPGTPAALADPDPATGAEPPAAQNTETTDVESETPEARAARRRAAREARIQEYLRRREERRSQPAPVAQGEGTAAAEGAAEGAVEPRVASALAATEPAASEPAAPTQTPSGPGTAQPVAKPPAPLPRGLALAQAAVRETRLGTEPTVQAWLDRIDRQQASPQQLAAFGNFLADNGLNREALEYYGVAVRLQPKDSLLWTNLGTLQRQLGDLGQATSAYQRALALDRNNSLAHYNLGAVHDQAGRYEAAISEYKLALTLDPKLGDPTVNPQAANNDRLLAVKLLLYREQAGSMGLPLSEVPDGTAQPSEP